MNVYFFITFSRSVDSYGTFTGAIDTVLGSSPLCKCHKRTTNYRALLQQMTYKRSASFMCLIYHKRTTNYRALLQKMTCKRNVLFMCLVYVQSGEDSRTHRMPYLHRSFSAKEPYHHWLFCRKETCNLRHPVRAPFIWGGYD